MVPWASYCEHSLHRLAQGAASPVPTMEAEGKRIVGVPTARPLMALLGFGDEITEPVL